MKTRQEKCVYIICLVMLLLAWVLPSAGQADHAVKQPGEHPGITGEWQGAIGRQHLILKIEQPAEGKLQGKIISVDQGNVSIPIDTLSLPPAPALPLHPK